jgi:hypothetical protein
LAECLLENGMALSEPFRSNFVSEQLRVNISTECKGNRAGAHRRVTKEKTAMENITRQPFEQVTAGESL